MDSYVTDVLVGTNIEDQKLKKIIDAVRNIRVLVKNVAKQAETSNKARDIFLSVLFSVKVHLLCIMKKW